MIKNTKGITIVEIIVSVTLVSIVLILLLSIFITVRNEDERNKISSNLLMNQVLIAREIESDFLDLGLIEIASCADGGADNDSVLSILPSSSSITKEAIGYCLKLIYNPSKTKDNVGYLLQYSYGFSKDNLITVIGYVRGDKKTVRETPVLSDTNGLVKNKCGEKVCAVSISMPVVNEEEEDYGINLSYIFSKDMGFKFTDLELANNYRFEISNTYVFEPEEPEPEPNPDNFLVNEILAQGGGVSAIKAKDTPDFNKINGISGLYAAEDNYDTSYYYRGLKTELNNNLIWGSFQWKIVRINGDGSIRLVYNGTEAQFNDSGTLDGTGINTVNDTGANTQIIKSVFNSRDDDAKYVGYMYGGADGVASTQRDGLIPAAATFNETSSTIKGVLDTWYSINISGKPFESQVVNNLFCNDRQLRSEVGGDPTGEGFGTNFTYYAPNYRLSTTTKTPTLKCGQQNDCFTTSDDTEKGNGKLTYPVGLLTADEAAMAGLLYNNANDTNYLYTGQNWWSLSPSHVGSSGEAGEWFVHSGGHLYQTDVNLSSSMVRPAISISSVTQVSGEGSATDPFKAI
ncbi:MAG: hypothetical protein PHX04_04915 [Bacilli bacterium]|nr:hypothetical protein [Bacilli bacterium]